MYEIYETKAYILRALTKKESDQRILLFTQRFGLVWANVSGSKKEGSKMRGFLQELTFCDVFLVQGKTGYRITGGRFVENIFFSLRELDKVCQSESMSLLSQERTDIKKAHNEELQKSKVPKRQGDDSKLSLKTQSIKNIFILFEKIFHHGEPEEEIFSLLEGFVLDVKKHIDKKKIKEVEVIFLSKIFFLLGYLDEKDLLEKVGEKKAYQDSEAKLSESWHILFSEKQISDLRVKINENISKIAF